MNNLFGSFDNPDLGNPTDDSEDTKNKFFDLPSYSEYLEKEDERKNKKKTIQYP